jgi:uncharacterized protein
MENNCKVTQDKLEKYRELSTKALKMAEENISKERAKEAAKIFEMVKAYLSDAEYFEKKGDFVNAFAALNYLHGWLDCGARLEIFKVKDSKLFTIP